MEKLGGNDVIEMWGMSKDATSRAPHVVHADRQVQDQRAKLVFDFLRSWGYAAAMGDVLAGFHGEDKPQKAVQTHATDLAMRACEMVDAAWNELKHRGWIVELPPYGDEGEDNGR